MNAKKLKTLSGLFSYPEKLPDTNEINALLPEGGHGPDRYFRNLQSLREQYVFLFINALPQVPCPPYGSFYLEGVIMGESTVRLKNLYLEYGFETDEMADHIAVELEFLSFLSTLSTDSTNSIHKVASKDRDFLLEHMREWTPGFFDLVEKNDEIGFYREIPGYTESEIGVRKEMTNV